MRRTTSIDMLRPDGLFGDLVLVGRGRDLRTDTEGTAHLTATGAVEVRIDFVATRNVLAINTDPPAPGASNLRGVRAGSGFRTALAAALPDERRDETLVHQLLDDVPVATLISAAVYARNGYHLPHHEDPHRLPWIGICAGWAPEATMTVETQRTGLPSFVGEGPPAASLDTSDPWAWHDLPPLPPTSYRRLRFLDAGPVEDGEIPVEAWFRDSYIEPDGTESVVHEYSVDLAVSAEDLVITRSEVIANVLPGPDCINARASGARVVGSSLVGMRARVGDEFVGISTCTHLNDVLRSLEGLVPLLRPKLHDA